MYNIDYIKCIFEWIYNNWNLKIIIFYLIIQISNIFEIHFLKMDEPDANISQVQLHTYVGITRGREPQTSSEKNPGN